MTGTGVERYTAELAFGLESDEPTELVDGEIVEMVRPGARHGVVCAEVAFLLKTWNKANRRGRVAANDSGVITERGPDSVRGPDLFFIEDGRIPGGVPIGWVEAAPNLCVEVLSPHDQWVNVLAKVQEYLTLGVDEVWVIDPESRQVHIFRRDVAPTVLTEAENLTSAVLPGFACRVTDLFAEC